jgi:hypothetical protein
MCDSARLENDLHLGLEPATTQPDALLAKREVVKATRSAPLARAAAFRGASVAAAAAEAGSMEADEIDRINAAELEAMRKAKEAKGLPTVPTSIV